MAEPGHLMHDQVCLNFIPRSRSFMVSMYSPQSLLIIFLF